DDRRVGVLFVLNSGEFHGHFAVAHVLDVERIALFEFQLKGNAVRRRCRARQEHGSRQCQETEPESPGHGKSSRWGWKTKLTGVSHPTLVPKVDSGALALP